MNIAVLSGKGGTGKTTVSTNLASLLNANYIDCDVEEPNGYIFLKPEPYAKEEVLVDYPYIDEDKCKNCGKCVRACEFNALVKVEGKIILFDKLCHGCGACQVVCPSEAIIYKKRRIGIVEEGKSNNIICKRGLLDIGEPMAVPVIKHLLNSISEGINIIDCPPGTSCNVVNALNYADRALLVTEPTEFGLHDLKMAVELVRMYKIPLGIIVNKELQKENMITEYCFEEKIEYLGGITYSRKAAELYSNGKMLIEDDDYMKQFNSIISRMKEVF